MNDAVAYIRSLAQMRGRNVEWAEKAVRQAASLSAEEALKEKVIDLMAADVPALLRKLDGREVTLGRPAGASWRPPRRRSSRIEADWRTKLLAVITNPNVASLLMLIGVYALIFEFYSPGMIGPGVVGAICILLALYAFQVLPVDYTGLALLLLGIGMMVAEAFIGAFGALGIGGLVAFVIGSIMLMRGRGARLHRRLGAGRLGRAGLRRDLRAAHRFRHAGAPPSGRRRPRADDRQRRPGAGLAGRRRPGAGARRAVATPARRRRSPPASRCG